MPGGLFFPPPMRGNASASQDRTVEYYRAMAAILPLTVMGVLVVICFICAECCGKRKPKAKEHRSPAKVRPPRDPNRPFSAKEELARERVLRTPTGSPETPPSVDYMNMSFEYIPELKFAVRKDLLDKFKPKTQSPVLTSTPPFARILSPTPPVPLKKEEDTDQPTVQDQPGESRSPSPRTLILQGKQMRYGAWIRTPETSSSSTTPSDTNQSMFEMSLSDEEAKRAKEKERQEKMEKRILREKRRLKKEMKRDQAEILWQQVTRTAKEEADQALRESKAIDIPPRKRVEEHPEYQRMVIAMVEENNAEFEATTVLNSAWEKGRMDEFIQRNLGYAPEELGAVGGLPVPDITALRYVKGELLGQPEVDDDSLPLLPKEEKEDPKKTKATEEEDKGSQRHRRARRKKPRETKGKSGRRRVPPPKTDPNIGEYMGQYYVKWGVPVTALLEKGIKPWEKEEIGEKTKDSPRRGVKWNSPLETVYTIEPSQPQKGPQGSRRKTPLKAKAKDELDDCPLCAMQITQFETGAKDAASQLQLQHGAEKKIPVETAAEGESASVSADSQPLLHGAVKEVLPKTAMKSDTIQPPIHLSVQRVSGAKGEDPQHHEPGKNTQETVSKVEAPEAQFQHGARPKTSLQTVAKVEASQLYIQQGARPKTSLQTAAKGEASQPQFQQGARPKTSLQTSVKDEVSQPQIQQGARPKTSLQTSAKSEASQPQFQQGARPKTTLQTSVKGKSAAVADGSQPLLLEQGARKEIHAKTEPKRDVFQPSIHLPVTRAVGAKGEPFQPLLHHQKGHEPQAVDVKKLKGSVDTTSPLFHHYGAGKNYGTMVPEVHPIGVFTKKMLDKRVPNVVGKEFEEKSLSETRKVSAKIAKAVFNIEMLRIEHQLVSQLMATEKDGEQRVVEIHPEPSSSGGIKRKPIPEVEVHQKPSSSELRKKPSPVVEGKSAEIHQGPSTSGLTRKKPSPVVEEDEQVVEIHQKPSASGLIRKPSSDEVKHVVEIHQRPPSSSELKKPSSEEGKHAVEIHQRPSTSELRKKPSSAEGEHVVEIHQRPSSTELRRELSPARAAILRDPPPSGLTRKKPSSMVEHVIEIHPEPSSTESTRKKPSHVAAEGKHAQIPQGPSSSGLTRRKQSPVVDKSEHVIEVRPDPSPSELRKKPVVEEDDSVVELSDEELISSSWEDVAPEPKYVWWPGIGDRKKKGDKRKKYGRW